MTSNNWCAATCGRCKASPEASPVVSLVSPGPSSKPSGFPDMVDWQKAGKVTRVKSQQEVK